MRIEIYVSTNCFSLLNCIRTLCSERVRILPNNHWLILHSGVVFDDHKPLAPLCTNEHRNINTFHCRSFEGGGAAPRRPPDDISCVFLLFLLLCFCISFLWFSPTHKWLQVTQQLQRRRRRMSSENYWACQATFLLSPTLTCGNWSSSNLPFAWMIPPFELLRSPQSLWVFCFLWHVLFDTSKLILCQNNKNNCSETSSWITRRCWETHSKWAVRRSMSHSHSSKA